MPGLVHQRKSLGCRGWLFHYLGCRPPGFLDLFFRGFGKSMRRYFECLGYFAVAKDHKIVFRFFDQPAFMKHLRGDLIARCEVSLDLCQADLDPLFLKDVRETALGQSALKGHLPTFKSGTAAVT